ncbi:MAG: hypothetical protein ACRC46_13510 [Thermoguttaceae bacterium]
MAQSTVQNQNSSDSCCVTKQGACKCREVCLSIFVGFLFGVIAGFAAKDAVVRLYFSAMSPAEVVQGEPVARPPMPVLTPTQEQTAITPSDENTEGDEKPDLPVEGE